MNQRPVPKDFAIHAKVEISIQLEARYRCGSKLITRWRQITGVKAPNQHRIPKLVPLGFKALASTMHRYDAIKHFGIGITTLDRWVAETGARFKTFHRFSPTIAPALTPAADSSLAGQAAQHLRRIMPVYKASVLDPKRTGYIVGGRAMATEEMIAMAARKGWDAASA